MGDGRDAEAALRGDAPLGREEREGADPGIHRSGAEGPRQLPEALGQDLVEIDRVVEVVLVRGDVAAVGPGADPHAVELRDLLGQRHRRDEGVDALIGGQAAVAPGGGAVGRDGGGGVDGHPLTAPVRPPTMRRWARVKNSSAGSIAIEVNASTPAVSCE